MGLDQYLYRVKDMDKFKKLSKTINDLDSKLDKRYIELLNKFKEKHLDDIVLFKEKLVKLQPDLHDTDIDRFGNKLYDLVGCMLDPDYENTMEKSIELLLFNIFPLIHKFECNEGEETVLKKKLINNVKLLIEDIVKRLSVGEKEGIINFYNLVKKLDKMVGEFNNNTDIIIYWRKANMIHGWFLKNVSWIEDNVTTDVFKGSVLDNLVSDVETVVNLIEEKYDVNDYIIITEEDPIYRKIIELLPPTPGYFFGSNDIDNIYYEILKHALKDLKDRYNQDDDYYYHASW